MPVTRPGIWASPLMYRLELFSMRPASKNGQNVHLTSMSIHTFIPDFVYFLDMYRVFEALFSAISQFNTVFVVS